MCTKAEVKEVVASELATVLAEIRHMAESIHEMKAAIKELPCNFLNEEIIKLKLKSETWESERENLFERMRKVEESGTIKIKWIVTAVISAVIGALVYKVIRG